MHRQNNCLDQEQCQIQRLLWVHMFQSYTIRISGSKDRLAYLQPLEIVKKEEYFSQYYK